MTHRRSQDFYTKDKTLYSIDYFIELMDDKRFLSLNQEITIENILNSADVSDIFSGDDWDWLIEAIVPLYDKTNNGVFDWRKESQKYYCFFNEMLHNLNCSLENEAGDVISVYSCELSDTYRFHDQILSLNISDFNCDNGDPIGAQLALDMVECFIKDNKWHVGFYDNNNILITDIASWARSNTLDIKNVTPVVWFGHDNDIQECWSITPKTSDSFLKDFWGDYFEGALWYICNDDAGVGIYYSIWEYDLDYNAAFEGFDNIKACCPINIELIGEERTTALNDLIMSIYNNNR